MKFTKNEIPLKKPLKKPTGFGHSYTESTQAAQIASSVLIRKSAPFLVSSWVPLLVHMWFPLLGQMASPLLFPKCISVLVPGRSPVLGSSMYTEMKKCDARPADFRCCETSARPLGKMRLVFVFIRKSKMPTRFRGVRRRVSTEVRGRPLTESGGRVLNENRDRPHSKKGDAPWTKNWDEPATQKLSHEMWEGEVSERMEGAQGSCEGMCGGRRGVRRSRLLGFFSGFFNGFNFFVPGPLFCLSLVLVPVPSGGTPGWDIKKILRVASGGPAELS